MEITELYDNNIFNYWCKKYGKELYEDLKNDVILLLLENKNFIKIKEYLLPYSIQTIRFYSLDKKKTVSEFTKKYKYRFDVQNIENFEEIKEDEPTEESTLINKVIKDCNTSGKLFAARILVENANGKSIVKIAKQAGLPYDLTIREVRNYKKELKQWQK